MIDCYVNIYNDNDEFRIPLTDSGSYEVRENDKLVFHLIISEHDLLTPVSYTHLTLPTTSRV